MPRAVSKCIAPFQAVESNCGIIMPASMQRRSLLTRGAALGMAGQTGLLGLGILGSSSAHSETASYTERIAYVGGTYFVGSVEYDWRYSKFKNSAGVIVHYSVFRQIGATWGWNGYKWDKNSGDLRVIWDFYPNNLTVTYSVAATDSNSLTLHDPGELRRLTTRQEWGLYSSDIITQYHQVPAADCNEDIFAGVSYRRSGVMYTKYWFREHEFESNLLEGNWVTYALTTVTGADRTALLNAYNDHATKVAALRVAHGLKYSTLAVISGGIATGLAAKIITKSDVSLWVIATGVMAAVVAGIAVTVAPITAMQVAVASSVSLILKCEEYLSA